jgi:O-antigen/teichoic acid export membrane protein
MGVSWLEPIIGQDIKATLKNITTHKITTNTFVLSVGRFVTSALGLLIGMLVARTLGAADFGIFSIAMAVFEIAVVFTEIGIGISLVRFVPMYSVEDSEQADYYLKVGFWTLLCSAFLVTSLGLMLSPTIAVRIYHKPQLVLPIRLGFVAVLGGILWSYLLSSFHAREFFSRYAVFSVIVGLLKLGVIGALVYLAAMTVTNVLITYILLPVVGFVLGMIYTPTRLFSAKGKLKETIRSLINFSKWIFLMDFLFMLSNRIDLLILGYYVKDEVMGHYSMAYMIISIFTILTSSLVNVLLPYVCKFNSMEQIREYVRKIPKITFVCALVLLPVIFIMGPVIRLVLGQEYAPSILIFQVMFFGFLVSFIVDPIYLVAYAVNKPRILSMLCVVRLMLSAGSNILLIPRYGALGAATASMLTNFLVGMVGISLIYNYVYKLNSFAVES